MFTCRSVVHPVRSALMAEAFFSDPFAHAQTSAVVHQFNFTVAEELTIELSVNDRSRNVLSGYTVSTSLPEALMDSIAVDAERALSNHHRTPGSLRRFLLNEQAPTLAGACAGQLS